jgi:hypothetical protein
MKKLITAIITKLFGHLFSHEYQIEKLLQNSSAEWYQLVAFYDGKFYIAPRSVSASKGGLYYEQESVEQSTINFLKLFYGSENLKVANIKFFFVITHSFGSVTLNPTRLDKLHELHGSVNNSGNITVSTTICIKLGFTS